MWVRCKELPGYVNFRQETIFLKQLRNFCAIFPHRALRNIPEIKSCSFPATQELHHTGGSPQLEAHNAHLILLKAFWCCTNFTQFFPNLRSWVFPTTDHLLASIGTWFGKCIMYVTIIPDCSRYTNKNLFWQISCNHFCYFFSLLDL